MEAIANPPAYQRARAAVRYDNLWYLSENHLNPKVNAEKTFTKVTPKVSLSYGFANHTLYAALGGGVEAAVVVLADGPELAPAAVERVVGAWRESGADVVAASYGGVRGHPVVLGRAVWGAVPDEGARALEPVLVPCDDLGAPGDVDRPEDLQ